MYYANVIVNLIVQNVVQIKSEIITKFNVSAKNIYEKKVIFGILLHVVPKTCSW